MIINKITDNARQEFKIQLSDGAEAAIELFYSIRTLAWYLTLKYKEKEVYNIKLVSSIDNILYQYENVLPFKIKVGTNTGFSPLFISDFVNGNNWLDITEIQNNLN